MNASPANNQHCQSNSNMDAANNLYSCKQSESLFIRDASIIFAELESKCSPCASSFVYS